MHFVKGLLVVIFQQLEYIYFLILLYPLMALSSKKQINIYCRIVLVVQDSKLNNIMVYIMALTVNGGIFMIVSKLLILQCNYVCEI